MRQKIIDELVPILGFFIFPLLLFWPVTLGGRTLIPFDNLYAWLPWQAFAQDLRVDIPQNALLSDLVLENFAWKSFIRESIATGQLPLWNPYHFAGVPFLAAGQHSALYPISLIYLLLPLPQAYGWFTLLHFSLSGVFTYFYLRVIGLGRWPGFIGGITYSGSMFMVTHVVFPMVLGEVTWLPLILASLELAVRTAEPSLQARHGRSPLPYLLLGSLAMGMQFLAGHIEFSYYIVLVTIFYGAMRLAAFWGFHRQPRKVVELGLGILIMLGLGAGLAAGQLIPLYELVARNFRQTSVDYNEVTSYAYPLRQVITFFIPDFFGNPSHHSYFDLASKQLLPFSHNYLGQSSENPFWGIKNYVEAGAYIGILPLILSAVAVVRYRSRYVLIFAAIALTSLLFIFGTPLYALLYYLLPGFSQLHTPFRWVFPYTLSMAVLAAFGAEYLSRSVIADWVVKAIARVALVLGVLLLLILAIIFIDPQTLASIAKQFVESNSQAQAAFPDGLAFLSYEWRNLLFLALATTIAGMALTFLINTRWANVGRALAAGGLIVDLFLVAWGFNPAADPELAEFTPPTIRFLQEDTNLFRITTFDIPGQKLLNPNAGMLYGLEDIRGYDSIIPKQYTDVMSLLAPQGELPFNRIAPLTDETSLASPLLDLLNVKYVLTTQEIAEPGYRLAYDGELKIYENEDYLPRAFVVPRAEVVADEPTLQQRLLSIDLREVVLITEEPPADFQAAINPRGKAEVGIVQYRLNEVEIQAEMPWPGWLVLSDSYFPGWQAYQVSDGGREEGLPIYRADLNFRAVPLTAGSHTVVFRYSPLSSRLGFFVSFLTGMLLLLGFGYWAWRLVYRAEREQAAVWRVAKNSLIPFATSLFNKGIDFAFALIMLRILGPEGQGKYGFAIFVVAYLEIFTNFGMSTLLTREVAKDKAQGNLYLSHTVILRLVLLAVASPFLLLFIILWQNLFHLAADTALAILLLAVGLIPGNLATALSSLFLAHEKMEYPAGLTTLSTVLKVSLGLFALLWGYGFVGLALVSILGNLFSLAVLFWLATRLFFRPDIEFHSGFSREILKTSYPLMINHLLNTLFFRVDIALLQPIKGDRVVGWYTTPYKILDGLLLIPSTFTFAIFPIMSRLARDARESLIRAYQFSLKWLIIISLPLVLLIFAYADDLILILGGSEFLPHSAIALRLLIWFLPLSFVNGLTQYVLIAVNQQSFLTKAFLLVFLFNLVSNLLFIPLFSYQASAVITVLSELVLFLPFYYAVRKNIAPLAWWRLILRPGAAAGVMGGILYFLASLSFLILVPLSLLGYGVTLLSLGTIGAEERRVLSSLLPERLATAIRQGKTPVGE